MTYIILAGEKGNYAEVTAAGKLKVETEAEITLTSIETEIQGTLDVAIQWHTVVEVKTEADATLDVITFAANIYSLEIWHDETTAQSFVVNGLTLKIGPGGWRSPIGGTAALTVGIPAAVTCVVSRLT